MTAKRTPRLAVLADKEWRNLKALADYSRHNPDAYQLGGVIVPGGNLDGEILHIMARLETPERKLVAIPDGYDWHFSFVPSAVHEALGNGEYAVLFGAIPPYDQDVHYLHAPYDPAMLKSTEYRRGYCEGLLEHLGLIDPDLIFLSNFMAKLDRVIIDAYPQQIISDHPSVLPLNKGYRPELRAWRGENPDAYGYTVHFVDENMDCGATIFQQRVPLGAIQFHGEQENVSSLEEDLRDVLIDDQSRHTPRVLALVASAAPRTVVEDEEVFAAENRPDFVASPAYKTMLQQEYNTWLQQQDGVVSYEKWHDRHRTPYRRVLFDAGNGWETAEAILQPRPPKVARGMMPARYSLALSGDNGETRIRLYELLGEAGNRGGKVYHTQSLYQGGILHASVLASALFGAVLEEHGIAYEAELQPARAGAQRKPILPS